MTATETFVTDLPHHVSGAVLLPGSDAYAALATPWNVANASAPVAVVAATNADDVAATIRLAADHGVDVTVQATGHGALPFTRPTVMVHTGQLDELSIDDAGVARIGAGVRWQAVLDAGAARGLAGLCGSAPGVGVVGYLTGGGMGPVARTYGYASDYVVAFAVVTGDGIVRRATPTENPALFWGLRGGKGALGIVTAVEMQLVPLAEIYAGALYFAADDIETVAHAWREWSATLPEQATTSFAVLRLPPLPMVPPPLAGQVTAAVRFAWVGNPADGKAAFAPIEAAAPAVLGGVDVLPYAALGAIHADPVDPMPTHEQSTLLRELPAEALAEFLARTGPAAESPQVIAELRLMGGALGRPAEYPSAVGHRDAAYNMLAIGIAAPPVIEATAAHASALVEALRPWSTGGRLPNFGASAAPSALTTAYDAPTLDRLRSLVGAYDPYALLTAAHPFRVVDQ